MSFDKTSISNIKCAQYLCRPAGAKRPSSVQGVTSPEFPLSPLESKSVSFVLRRALKGEIPAENRASVDRIDALGKDILGRRVNIFRALVSQLALDERSCKSDVYGAELRGKFHKLKGETPGSYWNSKLSILFYVVEASMYDFSANMHQYLREAIQQMDVIAPEIPSEIFKSQREHQTFLENYQFLLQSINHFEKEFHLLLMPAAESVNGKLTERHVEVYRNLLFFIEGGVKRYIRDRKTDLARLKSNATKDQFLSSWENWLGFIRDIQSDLDKIMPLHDQVCKGNQAAFYELKNLLSRMAAAPIQATFTKMVVPSMQKLVAERALYKTFDQIATEYNITARHLTELFARMSDALFLEPYKALENCTDFMDALAHHLNVRSAHLTPLDICRTLWTEPYIAHRIQDESVTTPLGRLEIILHTLQSPGKNVYDSALNDLPKLLEELKGEIPDGFPQEPLEMLERVSSLRTYDGFCKWLNTPLLHPHNQGNPHPLLCKMLDQLQSYMGTSQTQTVRIGADPERPTKVVHTTTSIKCKRLIDIINELKQKSIISHEDMERFCARIHSILPPPSSDDLENLINPHHSEEVRSFYLKDLYFREDVRNLYLRPFLSLAAELQLVGFDQVKVKIAKQIRSSVLSSDPSSSVPESVDEPTPVPDAVVLEDCRHLGEYFESLIPRASFELKAALNSLVESLKEPYMLEPIYQAASRCLEAHLKPEENHVLYKCASSQPMRRWLQMMQSFLPVRFSIPVIDAKKFARDMQLTAHVLGLYVDAFKPLKLHSLPEGNVKEIAELHVVIEQLTGQKALIPCNWIPQETVFEYKFREAMVREIFELLSSHLNEMDSLITLCEQKACPPTLLKTLALKTGQVIEGALKLHLLQEAIPSVENPHQHICFTRIGKVNRLRAHDHDLIRTHEMLAPIVPLDSDQLQLLESWRHFAHWTRYLHESQEDAAEFLQDAELLYKDFHSDEDIATLRQLGYESNYREELFKRQNDEFIPQVKSILKTCLELLKRLRSNG